MDVTCGFRHTLLCTARSEVFSWGAEDGLGVFRGPERNMRRDGQGPPTKEGSSVPLLIEAFEGLCHVKAVFAGLGGSFAICDMPCASVIN